MFSLFNKRQRHQVSYDRAFAEFTFGRNSLAFDILDKVIVEGTSNFQIYNLRATVLINEGEYHLAFKDFNTSIDLQPKLDMNQEAYLGREKIIKWISSGEIKLSVPDLAKYFNFESISKLVLDSILGFFEDEVTTEQDLIRRSQILGLEYSIMRISQDGFISKKRWANKFYNSTASVNRMDLDKLKEAFTKLIDTVSQRSNYLHVNPYLLELYLNESFLQKIKNKENLFELNEIDIIVNKGLFESIVEVKSYLYPNHQRNLINAFRAYIRNEDRTVAHGFKWISRDKTRSTNDKKDQMTSDFKKYVELFSDDQTHVLIELIRYFKLIYETPMVLN